MNFDFGNIFILAICHQHCYNGGTCTSPGMCTCASGWGGGDCRQGMNKVEFNGVFVVSGYLPA